MNELTLKWGTLKSYRFDSPAAQKLLNDYNKLEENNPHLRATNAQKKIVCKLIDECDTDVIYIHWDGVYVSKQEAKKYVMEYGTK